MKRRKLILVANDVGGVGGMEKHLEQMILRLRHVYDVTVVASSLRLSERQGVRFIRVPAPRRPFPLMMFCFSIWTALLLPWLRKTSIIHTTGAITWSVSDLSTIHFCHRGYVNNVVEQRGHNRPLLYRAGARLSLCIKLLMERYCFVPRRTRRLVAVSQRVADELAENYAHPQLSVQVIPNGVDIERFFPATSEMKQHLRRQRGIPQDGRYLLFMGGDWERKGLQFLLEAFNRIAGKHSDVYVLVVGAGDTERVKSFVALQYRERVLFVGRQSDPEIWCRLADVFVFPSNYEACSLAVLEAAASGLALLLTPVGGAEDIVTEAVSGWFIARDVESISEKLERLMAQPSLIQTFGQAARQKVESMTWDDTFRQFLQLYDAIAAEKWGAEERRVHTGVSV